MKQKIELFVIVQMFDLFQLAEAGKITTPDGEEWRYINVPRFRRTENPSANQFASSFGRIMTNNNKIVQAKNDYLKVSIPTFGELSESVGSSSDFSLHVVICCTFHGYSPDESYTVDHINRCHWDNRSSNLRWASALTQCNNREYCHFSVTYNGEEHTKLSSLAKVTGKRKTYLRGVIKRGSEHLFNITSVQMKKFAPAVAIQSPVCKKIRTRHTETFDLFVNKETVCDIAKKLSLKESTVIDYICRKARDCDNVRLQQLQARLGLMEKQDYDGLVTAVRLFCEGSPTQEMWESERATLYVSSCSRADPPLRLDDHRIVQSTYKLFARFFDST